MFDAFTSDPHYGHARVIEYSKRPFASVEEMDEALIASYNSVVSPRDNCLWLGDCFLCPFKKAEEIMSRLNGRKFLVIGNHDRKAAKMASIGFELVVNKATLHIENRIVRASHFPYKGTPSLELVVKEPSESEEPDESEESEVAKSDQYKRFWDRAKGEFLLHGHTHSKDAFKPGDRRQIHVGVDAWNFKPARFEEIQRIIAKS